MMERSRRGGCNSARALGTLLAVGLVAAGCASIVSGTRQDVRFATTPAGARVVVDGEAHGQTPVTVKLARKQEHAVRIEMPGFQPYEMQLNKSLNGWFVGNIVFGGLIGIIVDASNGAMYKLTPAQVQAELTRQVGVDSRDDAIYVAVTLLPDPSWERIGTLARR